MGEGSDPGSGRPDYTTGTVERHPLDSVYRLATLFQLGAGATEWEPTFADIPPKLRRRVHSMKFFFRMSEPGCDREKLVKDFTEEQAIAGLADGDVFAAWDIWALQLLGESKAARDLGERYLQQMERMKYMDDWMHLAKYLIGGNEASLKERAKTDVAIAHAQFAVAIRCLTNDKRQDAQAHFERVLATNATGYYVHWWSEAFVQRLQTEPNWLPWLKHEGTGYKLDGP